MKRGHYYCLFILACIAIGIAHVQADPWVWADRAVDGDTLRLKDGRLVRYIGIDTPEIDHGRHRADPFGWEAKKSNQQLVGGKRVRLEISSVSKDRYGRILAYVYDEHGQLINLVLIAKGLGYYYSHRYNNQILDDALLSAQRRAMVQRAGIWKELPLKSGPYIGNRRSRRFHTRQCTLGDDITPKNEIRFGSLWDAYWKGYAPCGRCLPTAIKKELKHRRSKQ